MFLGGVVPHSWSRSPPAGCSPRCPLAALLGGCDLRPAADPPSRFQLPPAPAVPVPPRGLQPPTLAAVTSERLRTPERLECSHRGAAPAPPAARSALPGGCSPPLPVAIPPLAGMAAPPSWSQPPGRAVAPRLLAFGSWEVAPRAAGFGGAAAGAGGGGGGGALYLQPPSFAKHPVSSGCPPSTPRAPTGAGGAPCPPRRASCGPDASAGAWPWQACRIPPPLLGQTPPCTPTSPVGRLLLAHPIPPRAPPFPLEHSTGRPGSPSLPPSSRRVG